MIDGREIAFIVAMTPERVIGVKGGLPWHISEDLRYFKEKTLGHAMIMGRKTFESLGGILPDRHHIIISRGGLKEKYAGKVHVCDSPEAALQVALSVSDGMIYVIGGGEIFRMMYDLADKLYVTEVDMDVAGDTYFPQIGDEWKQHAGDWQTGVDKRSGEEVCYRFVEYIRKTL